MEATPDPASVFHLEWRRYRRRLRKPLRAASAVIEEREGVVIRLISPGGEVGYGEAAPLSQFGSEPMADILARLEALGHHPTVDDLHGVEASLPCTRFAVECAIVEQKGLRLLPPVRQDRLPVVALCDLWEPAERGALARAAAGFGTLKFKVGLEQPGREIARIQALAARVPQGVQFRLDANGGLGAEAARDYLRELSAAPLEFLEQPLPAQDLAGLARLAAEFPGRVAVEESVSRARDLARLAAAGWHGPVVVKPSLLGTLVLWADAWARFSWPWVFSSALETGVGAGHALAIAFALSREGRALGFGVGDWLPDDGLGGACERPEVLWDEVVAMRGSAYWDRLPP